MIENTENTEKESLRIIFEEAKKNLEIDFTKLLEKNLADEFYKQEQKNRLTIFLTKNYNGESKI